MKPTNLVIYAGYSDPTTVYSHTNLYTYQDSISILMLRRSIPLSGRVTVHATERPTARKRVTPLPTPAYSVLSVPLDPPRQFHPSKICQARRHAHSRAQKTVHNGAKMYVTS